ncbi:MAG: hypothetical protein ACLUFU_03005 [Bacilli bacterium]
MERKINLVSYFIVIITTIVCYTIVFYLSTQNNNLVSNEIAHINFEDRINENTLLINNQIDYYEDNYNVTISLYDDIKLSETTYDINLLYNNYEISEALDLLGDYFKVFNKEFFNIFYENNMNGIKIYLADDINKIGNNYIYDSSVVGLFFKYDNYYIIVIDANSSESIDKIAFHETMHAIEEYFNMYNITFSNWNNYNPAYFKYTNNLSNSIYADVLGNNKNQDNIYFIDNYARSSEDEDRARTFEFLCLGEDFDRYPNLYAKSQYLKRMLNYYIPEINI